MLRMGMLCGALACLLACVPLRAADVALPPAAKTKIEFARDIEPLLAKRCLACHGAQQQMSGLRLDQKDAALKGGAAGVDILPGKSAESRLIRLVAGVDQKFMPPMGAHLTAEEIGLLRAWIDQGVGVDRAALRTGPSRRSSGPPRPRCAIAPGRAMPSTTSSWRAWNAKASRPRPKPPKLTLLRRVSLDLTGLPPTPEEVREFLSDNRPDAYERLVDRLLDSPHYGEKWARYWLDLARYADSDGYEKDRSRPWAWRYRHWVIDALNRDMPFDEFTIEQLAGDLLPNRNLDTLVATGFHRNTLTNREGGIDPEQFRDEQVVDRTATVGTVWLGLTVGCAQCHNHKYDPISQKEFYQLMAFFNTEEEVNIEAPLPGELGPYLAARPEYDRERQELLDEYKIPENLADWEAKLREAALHPGTHDEWDFAYGEVTHTVDNARKVLFLDPAKRSEVQQNAMLDVFLGSCGNLYGKEHCDALKLRELRTKLNELAAKLPPVSYAPVLLENDTPPKTYIHVKGDWRERGAEVQPGTLAVLPPMPAGETGAPRPGALAGLARESADRARGGESHLAGSLRPRHRPHLRRFRHAGRPSHASGTARLAGRRIHGARLEHEADGAPDGDVGHLPAVVERAAGTRGEGSGEHAAGAPVAPAPARGADPRRSALRRRPARSAHRRTQREAAAAEGRRRAFLRGLGEVGGEHRAGPLPPRPLHPLPAHRAVSAADELRRAGCEPRLHAPRAHRHAAAGAQPAERSGVLRSRAGAGLPHHARDQPASFRDRLNYAYAITLGREPTAREAERMGKYFDDTSRGLAGQTRKPWPRSSPIGWKACRRPKPRPGWS